MKFVFFILCFLLIFFNFHYIEILSKTKDSHFIIIWKITENIILFNVFPHDVFLLLDKNTFYLYLDDSTEESYISAINLKTNYKVNIINYIYLREHSVHFFLKFYDPNLSSIKDILNSL